MYLRLCLFHVSDFPENTYFPEMLFSGKENIFKCLVAFQKMLWKIFSGVWLYGWKCYFPTNFSHGNSTHGSKLRQSKATTTKTPPPHQHNNTKNQNHTEHQNTNKTQKKKSYSGQIERRRKRGRTIGFGVEDDRFWGATIAIGDDESVLRLQRSGTTNLGSRSGTTKGAIRTAIGAKAKSNDSGL